MIETEPLVKVIALPLKVAVVAPLRVMVSLVEGRTETNWMRLYFESDEREDLRIVDVGVVFDALANGFEMEMF